MVKGVEPSASVLEGGLGESVPSAAASPNATVDLLLVESTTLDAKPVAVSVNQSIDWDRGIYPSPDGRYVGLVSQVSAGTIAPGVQGAWDSRFGVQKVELYNLGTIPGRIALANLPSNVVNATPRWSPDSHNKNATKLFSSRLRADRMESAHPLRQEV